MAAPTKATTSSAAQPHERKAYGRPSTPTPTEPLRQLTAAERVEMPPEAAFLVEAEVGGVFAGLLVSTPRRVVTMELRLSQGGPPVASERTEKRGVWGGCFLPLASALACRRAAIAGRKTIACPSVCVRSPAQEACGAEDLPRSWPFWVC